MKRKSFRVGDLVAESHNATNIGFITKIQNFNILFQLIHGPRAGKIYSTHKDWLVHVDDIIHEDDE